MVGVPALLTNLPPVLKIVFDRLDELLARKVPERKPIRKIRESTILTVQQKREAADAYISGLTVNQVAWNFNVNRNVVLRIMDEFDAHVRPSVRVLNDEQVSEASQLQTAGMTLAKIGEHFSVDQRTIRRELAKLNTGFEQTIVPETAIQLTSPSAP